jgi:hypothetical protein
VACSTGVAAGHAVGPKRSARGGGRRWVKEEEGDGRKEGKRKGEKKRKENEKEDRKREKKFRRKENRKMEKKKALEA